MNYQSGVSTVAGVSTTVAGIAILPSTGEVSLLTYVGIAAIVTGTVLLGLQAGIWFIKRFSK